MSRLPKLMVAPALGLVLGLSMFSSGAFAQSVDQNTANSALHTSAIQPTYSGDPTNNGNWNNRDNQDNRWNNRDNQDNRWDNRDNQDNRNDRWNNHNYRDYRWNNHDRPNHGRYIRWNRFWRWAHQFHGKR